MISSRSFFLILDHTHCSLVIEKLNNFSQIVLCYKNTTKIMGREQINVLCQSWTVTKPTLFAHLTSADVIVQIDNA